MRGRAQPAVVVTDLREPLAAVHRRMIRTRTVLLGIWILGWVSTGFVYRNGWLAVAILVVTGPVLWSLVYAVEARNRPGRRVPVAPQRHRAVSRPGEQAPGGAADPP